MGVSGYLIAETCSPAELSLGKCSAPRGDRNLTMRFWAARSFWHQFPHRAYTFLPSEGSFIALPSLTAASLQLTTTGWLTGIRRNTNNFRQRLPVTRMRAVSARAEWQRHM
jgi:hypothetical protein